MKLLFAALAVCAGTAAAQAAAGSAVTVHGRHLTAIVRFDNVSAADMNVSESVFVDQVASDLGTDAAHVAVDTVQEYAGLSGSACVRLKLSGLGPGTSQASRMGYYYHTRQVYEGRPVYYSATSGNYLYYYQSKGWWLIGPVLGSEYASLITNFDAATPLDIPGSANWYVSNGASGWQAESNVTFGCSPAPSVEVKFRVGVACDSTADPEVQLQTGTINMLAALRTQGLMATSITLMRRHMTTCQPKIELEMFNATRDAALQPWKELKTSCHYNGHHLVIKHHKPASHHHFACKHTYDHLREAWDCGCQSWPDAGDAPTPSPTPAATTTTTTPLVVTTSTTAAPTTAAPATTTTAAPATTTSSTPHPTVEQSARNDFPSCAAAMLANCLQDTVDCHTKAGIRQAQFQASLSSTCPERTRFDFIFSDTFKATVPTNVDINRASVTELDTIYGIGGDKAEAIVDYRRVHGYFASVDALASVDGIGANTITSMFEHATVGGGGATAYAKPVVTFQARTGEAELATPAPTNAYGEWVFNDWWKMDEVTPEGTQKTNMKASVGNDNHDAPDAETQTFAENWNDPNNPGPDQSNLNSANNGQI